MRSARATIIYEHELTVCVRVCAAIFLRAVRAAKGEIGTHRAIRSVGRRRSRPLHRARARAATTHVLRVL